MRYNVIERIKKYIDEHDVLYDYETYEQMPIFYRYKELDCLDSVIRKEDYTAFFVNLAIMYVNIGLLYAKKKLTKEEQKDYLIYFMIYYIDEDIEEDGFVRVDVVFTRKAKEHLKLFNKPVDFRNTKINKYIKDIIGINEFSCHLYESKENDEYDQYYFFPNR